jgi:hypothetical protein
MHQSVQHKEYFKQDPNHKFLLSWEIISKYESSLMPSNSSRPSRWNYCPILPNVIPYAAYKEIRNFGVLAVLEFFAFISIRGYAPFALIILSALHVERAVLIFGQPFL